MGTSPLWTWTIALRMFPMRELQTTLHRFRMSFHTELRMLIFHWGYLLLHALWIMLLFFVFIKQRDYRSLQALLETTVGRISIGLISLAGIFLTGISASRSQRSKFIELEETFPTGFEIITGRWLAGLLSLLVFLLEPIGIATIQGPVSSLVSGIFTFISEAALTIAFTTAAAWAFIIWLKPGRWVYPLMAAAWLGFLLGPTLLTNLFPSASLLNFMRQGTSFYSELWGRLIYGEQPFWFNLFYTGLLLTAFALLVLRIHLHRYLRIIPWTGALIILSLGLTGLGGFRYISNVQAVQNAGNGLSGNQVLLTRPAFTVDDYDLEIDLNDPTKPVFTSTLTIHNIENKMISELSFTLNPGLTITDSNFPVIREEQLIFVHLPEPLATGDMLTLHFKYADVLRLETITEGVIEATDFIDPKGVRLTPTANWYPIPAGLAEISGLHDQAHMRLTITGSDLRFGANLPPTGDHTFEADGVKWVFLVGSPHLVLERIGSTILITSQNDLVRARSLVEVFAVPLQKITLFFPDAAVRGLVLMVLGEEGGLPDYTPPVEGYPLIVTASYQFNPNLAKNDAQLSTVIRALAVDLWQLSGGDLDPQVGQLSGLGKVFSEIVHFLRTYAQDGNDLVKMQSKYTAGKSQTGSDGDTTYLELMDIFLTKGESGIIQTIQQAILEADQLRQMPYDALPAWIRDSSRKSP
jgi:hypothetical protein